MAQIVMIICGILFLVLPKNILVDEKKLKPGQIVDVEVKKVRKFGWIILAGGLLMLFI